MRISNKDFIRTEEGLYFAVISNELEDGKFLCNLRYLTTDNDQLTKIEGKSATVYLEKEFPIYILKSKKLDASLHAVAEDKITNHYSPYERAQQLSVEKNCSDEKERLAHQFLSILMAHNISLEEVGIVGSLLIGAQNTDSDIDIIISNINSFNSIRKLIDKLIEDGTFQSLSENDWEITYQRRNCSIRLDEYIWHEKRKLNKFILGSTKFDISCIEESVTKIEYPVIKSYQTTITANLSDDCDIFKFPARYPIEHKDIAEILCYTATYTGQVFKNESFTVSGPVETDANGVNRIIVGTSKEANNEYLKVNDRIVT